MPSLHSIAILVIIVLFAIFLYFDFKNQKANPNFPTLLITTGIAFTFLGIAIGLQKFDISNTVDSLPHLINGIKTAFWGSFAGIVFAIILKLISIFAFKEEQIFSEEERQIQNFYHEHSELLQLFKTHYEVTNTSNSQLQLNNQILNRVLAQLMSLATEQTSREIVTLTQNSHYEVQNIHSFLRVFSDQIQKLMMDQHKKISDQIENVFLYQNQNSQHQIVAIERLQSELQNFSVHQTKQTTQILNDALKDTLTQLNQGLIDHLGQNFQEFNQSMSNVLAWQQQYAHHVEDQTTHYQTSAQQLTYIQNDFEKFIQQGQQFDQISKNLDHVLSHLHAKSGELDSNLTSLYQTLEQKVFAIDEANHIIQQSFDTSKNMVQEFKQHTHNIANDMQTMQVQLNQTFEQTHKNLKQELSMQQEKHNDALNESLLSLARQLGSISEKFAYDYEPITNNIKAMMLQLEQQIAQTISTPLSNSFYSASPEKDTAKE